MLTTEEAILLIQHDAFRERWPVGKRVWVDVALSEGKRPCWRSARILSHYSHRTGLGHGLEFLVQVELEGRDNTLAVVECEMRPLEEEPPR